MTKNEHPMVTAFRDRERSVSGERFSPAYVERLCNELQRLHEECCRLQPKRKSTPDDDAVQLDELTHFINGLVPLVPNEEARESIRRIFGTVGPGQNDRHMDHWQRGKLMQGCGAAVPYKHEDEHATGLYDQEIRPVLIGALLAWTAEHGAPTEDRHVPKATNELVLLEKGYRVERDRGNVQIELYRPDLTLAVSWWYGEESGDGEEGNPTLTDVQEAIERDITARAQG